MTARQKLRVMATLRINGAPNADPTALLLCCSCDLELQLGYGHSHWLPSGKVSRLVKSKQQAANGRRHMAYGIWHVACGMWHAAIRPPKLDSNVCQMHHAVVDDAADVTNRLSCHNLVRSLKFKLMHPATRQDRAVSSIDPALSMSHEPVQLRRINYAPAATAAKLKS